MVRMRILFSIEVVSWQFRSLQGRSNSIEQPYRLGGPRVPKPLYDVIQEA